MWEGVKVGGEKQPATLILLFTKKYTPYSYGVYFFYLFLLMIRDSNFPEAISMKRVKSEILFSAFSAFQIESVNSSILSVAISTGSGSPSKLGRGLPSPKYVCKKWPFPCGGFV